MLKTRELENKLRGRVSRTDMFTFLRVYEEKELVIQLHKGLWQRVPKPRTGLLAGPLNHVDRRSETKLRERQYEDQRQDRRIAELEAEQAAERELMETNEDEITAQKEVEVKLKYRRKFGLR